MDQAVQPYSEEYNNTVFTTSLSTKMMKIRSESVQTKNICNIDNYFKTGYIITFILAIVGNILLVLSLITNVICAIVLCGKLLVIYACFLH